MMRSEGCLQLHWKEVRIQKDKLFKIAKVGLPAGLQGSLFSISNVMIQSAVNSFGSTVMAGNAAAGNIEGFVYTSMNAVHRPPLPLPARIWAVSYTHLLLFHSVAGGVGFGLARLGFPLGFITLGVGVPLTANQIRFGFFFGLILHGVGLLAHLGVQLPFLQRDFFFGQFGFLLAAGYIGVGAGNFNGLALAFLLNRVGSVGFGALGVGANLHFGLLNAEFGVLLGDELVGVHLNGVGFLLDVYKRQMWC